MKEGSEATWYVRDGAVTVAVVEGGSLKHWTLTLPGGEVIGRVGSGGSSRRYYLKDHLGSIRAVLDGGGGVRETRDYYPFGLPMPGRYEEGSPPTQEDYTGYEKDEAAGLHYAGHGTTQPRSPSGPQPIHWRTRTLQIVLMPTR